MEDARRIVAEFVAYYNDRRLHSAIGYIAPKNKMEDRGEAILAEREIKLAEDRQARLNQRQESARVDSRKGVAYTTLVCGSRQLGVSYEREVFIQFTLNQHTTANVPSKKRRNFRLWIHTSSLF
ncbi:MAG: integrase core domain-containing protein [Anaerolineae bacterium]